jgi:hypothetical protein
LEELRRTELVARVEERVLCALEDGAPPGPAALLFLLRRYLAADSAAVAKSLERGLGVALAQYGDSVQTIDRADWLMLFVEAGGVSEDDRIPATIGALADALSAEWPADDDVERAGASIDACLRASGCAMAPTLIQRAIDELERVVANAYQPGRVSGAPQQVRLASALLTAIGITARLPYAMLAEELVRAMQRNNWDGPSGLFATTITLNCEAVRVLNRLGELHRDADYRAAAVLAPDADYASDAAAILEALSPHMPSIGFPFAPYGLALLEHSPESLGRREGEGDLM